ncbi:MAG: hypothetical protein AAB668_01530 [Patescibacteria group bacterium]
MKELTKGLPTAYGLVRRFEKRSVARKWDSDMAYDPEGRFRVETNIRRKDPVFVILLPVGSETPADDSLVWQREIEYGTGKRKFAPALFVDAGPCHPDWLALKMIHEFGCIEIAEVSREIASKASRRLDLPLAAQAFLLAPAVGHLNMYHELMIGRVVDRRLRGRIMSRVKILKTASVPVQVNDSLAFALIKDIQKLLSLIWPVSANNEENYARYELLRSITRGIILKEFNHELLLH